MPRSVSRNIRYAFVTLTAGLLMVAGVQGSAESRAPMGLSTCGGEDNPCRLEPLIVRAAPERLAERTDPVTDVARTAQHLQDVAGHSLRPQI